MRLFLIVISLLTVCCSLFTITPARAQTTTDWPTRGQNSAHTYFVPANLNLPTNKLYLKWKRFFGERVEVEMEPLVVGNTVYLGIMNGKLYALNADAGSITWTFTAGGPLTDTPTIATINGVLTIFFGSLDGQLYALNAQTGTYLWSYSTGAAIMNTPAVSANTVYTGSLDKHLYTLNATNGQLINSLEIDSPISNSPAIGELQSGNPGIFFLSGNNTAYALKVNGTLAWSKALRGAFTKRTLVTYSNGVVTFVTRKPGGEYSEPMENVPAGLQGTRQTGATVLNAWADYYVTYPDRRPLYYLRASDGADLWQPQIDKLKYTPLYLPYWGEYTPL
jgi:outer membrane protein assembly factor BamB